MAPSSEKIAQITDEEAAIFSKNCRDAIWKIMMEDDTALYLQSFITPDDNKTMMEGQLAAVESIVGELMTEYAVPLPPLEMMETETGPWETVRLDQFQAYITDYKQRATEGSVRFYLDMLPLQADAATDANDEAKQRAYIMAKGKLKINWIWNEKFFNGMNAAYTKKLTEAKHKEGAKERDDGGEIETRG